MHLLKTGLGGQPSLDYKPAFDNYRVMSITPSSHRLFYYNRTSPIIILATMLRDCGQFNNISIVCTLMLFANQTFADHLFIVSCRTKNNIAQYRFLVVYSSFTGEGLRDSMWTK